MAPAATDGASAQVVGLRTTIARRHTRRVAGHRLFAGKPFISYGQIYLSSGEWSPDLQECFAGQVNGLCGAAVPGGLWLTTNLHTGWLPFEVELHETLPSLDPGWEDVVEASLTVGSDLRLVECCADGHQLEVPVGEYRVRYCGFGMDGEDDGSEKSEPSEKHLVQLWPAPPAADAVIREGSAKAAYWHGFARDLPPPPTAEERLAAARRAAEEAELAATAARAAAARAALAAETAAWGGRLPRPEVRELRGNALSAARRDPALAERIAATDPAVQRRLAAWVARRAFTEAGLADIDWIAPALAALEQGLPLPAPFDRPADDLGGDRRGWDLLFSDPRVPSTTVTSLTGDMDNLSQPAMAFPALCAAAHPEPLQACLDALHAAAVTNGYGRTQDLYGQVSVALDTFTGPNAPPPDLGSAEAFIGPIPSHGHPVVLRVEARAVASTQMRPAAHVTPSLITPRFPSAGGGPPPDR
jgi:hypothetical protein